MGLDPIVASKNIVDKYLRYIETTFYINDSEYMEQFKNQISSPEHFSKGPYLDFSDSFKFGSSINELIDEDILSNEFNTLYKDEHMQGLLSRSLYKHQELAIRKLHEDNNIVVTTGTGSGKTESFLLPIINHLMREKEKDTLSDGVRALIIYPMNALANDQMKRMRETLKDYPDISFGAYTGETEHEDKKAFDKFLSLNDNKKPIPNERISRRQMKEKPPHILITNYAMLEYLLLRPDDNVFFNGEKSTNWKYIVLDEAHTYTGASGIEVSMLMRRLVNVLSTTNKIRFILTSATLGDEKANDDICDFASSLCAGYKFKSDSIIKAIRYSDFKIENKSDYPSSIYQELLNQINEGASLEKLKEVIRNYNQKFTSTTEKLSALLYDFIITDALYYRMRSLLMNNPITIKEISERLGITESEVVAFVSLARQAEKDNIALLDARYHMFVRALEGAYITLGKHNNLSIVPRDKTFIDGEEFVSFKINVCKHCGEIHIPATISDDYLMQSKSVEITNEYYMLLNQDNFSEEEFEDMEDQIFELCGKCGKIEKKQLVNGLGCDCHDENLVEVLQVKTDKKALHKCYACDTTSTRGSILRGFYIGQEAAASVIGSSIYEEIPSKISKIVNEINDLDSDFFGIDAVESESSKEVYSDSQNKQLLVFSDSRQEAAYFASYFDFTYNNILRRRLVMEALKELSKYKPEDGIKINTLVNKLAALFEQTGILEKEQDSMKEAWKTVLYEISSNDRNSLENLGLLSFQYLNKEIKKLGYFAGEDAQSLIKVLTNSFKRECIFDFSYSKEMLESDREYYSFNGNEFTMSLSLNKPDRKNTLRKSWVSVSRSNSRMDYLEKTLEESQHDRINDYLTNIWKLLKKEKHIVAKKPDQYVMDISNFVVKPSFAYDLDWYMCDKCGKLTPHNISSVCSTYRCHGKLKECNLEETFENNHYRKQYLNLDIFPLRVKEHTAQLSSMKAKQYQEMFIKNEINVLSCSTTFEMGVDVGELETVFMKNMPPSPSNYAQRAGRAGRRKNSVAYSLTFSRLSSHDLTYYKSPESMIRGKINPPKFKVENEKIVKRHFNAAIISAYWRKYPDRYKNVELFFEKNNFEGLIYFIQNLPKTTEQYIKHFLPTILSNNYLQWIAALSSEEGILYREYSEYINELEDIEKLKNEAIDRIKENKNNTHVYNRLDNYISKIKGENILSFLSKKNILPKYGFPVDTVELVTSLDERSIKYNNKSNDLRLQRDLLMAISEYAPGAEIIADGNLYRSQYIKRPSGQNKVWDLYDFGICQNTRCGHVNIKRHFKESYSHKLGECDVCGEEVNKENTFVIPEYGFIISPQIKKSTISKPEKTYKSEIFYVGDKEEITNNKVNEIEYNQRIVKVKSTSNDELVVINKSNFFVCETCGYAEKNDQLLYDLFDNKMHHTPYGRECSNERLYRRTLGHTFRTDVANISFEIYIDFKEALSILYALLEGVSKQLGIERNDISGTVHYNKLGEGDWVTNFILFDVVPGGAGHVRRLGEADGDEFHELLYRSYQVVKQCNCGEDSNGEAACYSCLCNYYNQKHHDILQRNYAIDFFESRMNILTKI